MKNVMMACLPVTIEELRKHCGYDMESIPMIVEPFFIEEHPLLVK